MRQVYYPRSFFFVTRNGPIELGARAADRLRWLKAWRALTGNGLSSHQAADALQIPRSTLYRWEQRLKSEGLRGLEDRTADIRNAAAAHSGRQSYQKPSRSTGSNTAGTGRNWLYCSSRMAGTHRHQR